MVDHPFCGQIGLITSQCYNDVWTSLSLQFLHPSLSSSECVLRNREAYYLVVDKRNVAPLKSSHHLIAL